MHSSFVSIFALALPLACSQGEVPEQLESSSVEAGYWEGADEPSQADGVLEVVGSSRDFQLTLVTEAEEIEIDLHSPAATDLRVFDGMDLSLVPVLSWSGNVSGLSIFEGEDLRYALVGADGSPEVEAAMGEDFASYGPELGRSRKDGFDYTWHTIAFATDNGAVFVRPGQIEELVVDGATWRVTVIAAYTQEARPNTPVADCGGGGDLLSYEMLLVEEAPREWPDLMERPQDTEMAARSCG